MPGITVTTASLPGPSSIDLLPGGRYFTVGITERGPLVPTLLHSMGEYASIFGAWVSYGRMYDDLNTFFAEGGTEACVQRAVGPTPTTGTLNLSDEVAAPSTGVSLVVSAAWPGAASANINVEVDAGAQANTFRIVVYYEGQVVESYNNLASPAAAVTAVNAVSNYISLAVGSSTAAPPQNNPVATVAGGVALSAGSDDRAGITSATMVNALANFGADYGPGCVGIPDYDASLIGSGVEAHCATFDRIYIGHEPQGSTVASAKTAIASLLGTTGAEGVGIFSFWVEIPNGSGATRTIPPCGYVAACRTRALKAGGPWKNPAGEGSIARFLVNVEYAPTQADINSLDLSRISAIRKYSSISGGAGGIRLYGWRSLSGDEVNYYDLTGRDTLNILSWLIGQRLQSFLFQPVDGRGQFFSQLSNAIAAILEPWRIAGGLYEAHVNNDPSQALVDPGYSIDTGPDVNTAATLGANQVNANVGVRLSPGADFINIAVTKVAVGTSL